ncbi:MAG: hypothetical protein HN597_00170 [Desulfobacula sp.]|jgi:type IV pilus assembly protein PilP|uniref:pilus assembly protein PilP n=1 Tax=Desulfobacula sp. TaxID=2593537 RepID=UPI0039B8CFD0|nr:hypothetical protein [Desulfobacula sp.]
MTSASKIILLALVSGFISLIFACDDKPRAEKKPAPSVISGKITSQPSSQNKVKKNTLNPKNNIQILKQKKDKQKVVKYDYQGKIDPFESLIQEKPEENRSLVIERPKRILTPLEKIGVNQIRLVAVIIMKNRRIAMVEEANGKGYEVGIGTYIGKNQGKVSEIKDSSIVIKELVKDYKGRLKEHVLEIKLNKIEDKE